MQLLIKKGASPKTEMLHRAAPNGHAAVVRLLVENGVDVDAEFGGKTALQRAASGGHEATVQILLDMGARIEASDAQGRRALHWAASNGQEATVRLLLREGADATARDNSGSTALDEPTMRLLQSMLQSHFEGLSTTRPTIGKLFGKLFSFLIRNFF